VTISAVAYDCEEYTHRQQSGHLGRPEIHASLPRAIEGGADGVYGGRRSVTVFDNYNRPLAHLSAVAFWKSCQASQVLSKLKE
jgi:hypothetical protein